MKDDYEVSEITLEDAESLIQKEHYLKELHGKKNVWTKHKCYGLFKGYSFDIALNIISIYYLK